MKVKVGVSAHHVHLKKETFQELFHLDDLTIRNNLNQIGEYASEQSVTLKTPKNEIKNVRILGPFRDYNQVEISRSESIKLGLNPPVRRSGDLKGSESITIVGPYGEMELSEAVILAERHIHVNTKDVSKYGLKDGELVDVLISGVKPGKMQVHVKVSDNGYYEMHLDTDDANAFLLDNTKEVEIQK